MAAPDPPLHSRPGATQKISLVFDGATGLTFNSFTGITVEAYEGSDADCVAIFNKVAEHYSPWDVDVTTEVLSPNVDVVGTVYIGGSYSDWYGDPLGGVTVAGSFSTGAGSGGYGGESFVFTRTIGVGAVDDHGVAVSHEASHQFGNAHQSQWSGGTLVNEYNPGTGNWGPLMGNAYGKTYQTWFNGPTDTSPSSFQDDMAKIALHLTYRTNDVANNAGAATALPNMSGTVSAVAGLLLSGTDKDYWSFTTSGGALSITMTGGQNVVPVLEIRDSGDSLVATSSGGVLSHTLSAGDYFLVAKSSGDYGYCGTYVLNGSITGGSGVALTDNLISYWKLDEASGNAVDANSTNNLTAANAPGSTTGILGNARTFVAASTQYFTKADNADLSTGDIDFTIQAWVKLTSKSAAMAFVGKWGSVSNNEFLLYYDNSGDRFNFIVTPLGVGAGAAGVTANNFGSPPLNTWIHLIAKHDSVNNVLSITVNDGTPDTNSYAAGVFDGTDPFEFGRTSDGGAYLNGVLDEVGLWKRILTGPEVTQLYGSGGGLAYPFTGLVAGTLTPTAASASSVSFSYGTNAGTPAYSNQLQRSPHGANTWSNIGSTVAGDICNFTDSTVAANTDYDYRVSVTDGASATATSATVRVITRTARAYYFATAGDDSTGDGTSGNPYKTISKATALKMQAGDSFYFNKGDTFTGSLAVVIVDGGLTPTSLLPIAIGSYGSGNRPIFTVADLAYGIDATNIPYTQVSGIKFNGPGVTLNAGSPNTVTTSITGCASILFNSTISSDVAGCSASDCEMTGLSHAIILGDLSTPRSFGLSGVSITNCLIHDNLAAGIDSGNGGSYSPVHSNWTISGNTVYNNFGDGTNNTGYGIIMAAVSAATVSLNVIRDNGQAAGPLASGGPCGIIGIGAVNCIVRGNVVARQQKNGNSVDGQGIDFDGNGCSGNLVERNYITSCDGEGITVLAIGGTGTTNTTVRFNVIEKCNAAIRIHTATDTIVHNNTFYQTGSGGLINTGSAGSGTKLYNNCLITGSGATLGSQATGVTFNGNLYDCSSFSIVYNGNTRASLAAFRSGDSQETATGFQTTADLKDAGNGPSSPVSANAVTAYDPASNSSHVVGTGLDISNLYSVNPGTLDYHGRSNNPASGYVIGAVALSFQSSWAAASCNASNTLL